MNYAKKDAGQIFFRVFYCSLSPWTCVHGSTKDLKLTLLGCGWQRRPLKRLLAPPLPEARGKGGSERRRWRPAQPAGTGRGGVGAQLFRFVCPSRSSTASWRNHCSDSHFSLSSRPASNVTRSTTTERGGDCRSHHRRIRRVYRSRGHGGWTAALALQEK